jgi:CrcB protein
MTATNGWFVYILKNHKNAKAIFHQTEQAKMKILLIGLGGALGSILRYITAQLVAERIARFPAVYGTFAVNIVGSLLIGIIYGLSERYQWLTPNLRFLLATGFCGGFTTFSAFAFDNVQLIQNGNYGVSIAYIVLSVVFCLAAAFAGFLIAR